MVQGLSGNYSISDGLRYLASSLMVFIGVSYLSIPLTKLIKALITESVVINYLTLNALLITLATVVVPLVMGILYIVASILTLRKSIKGAKLGTSLAVFTLFYTSVYVPKTSLPQGLTNLSLITVASVVALIISLVLSWPSYQG